MIYQILKYAYVGILNTFIGLATIFFFISIGLNAYLSNVLGYIVGLINSYTLNKKYVFKSKKKDIKEFYYFIISFLFSYLVNIILLFLLTNTNTNLYVSQFLSMIAFAICNFAINKLITFKDY